MADQVILEQSLESQVVDEPFVSRQSVYVIDSNNGAYNGQIQIDTSSLSNSGRWASYSEGVLQIPLVVTMEALSTTAARGTTDPQTYSFTTDTAMRQLRKQFAVGLKNGYFQLIHSLSVEYNNTSVVQLTPYLNHYVNYKLLTTFSEQDLEKWGTSLNFFPDSWTSHDYDQSTNVNAAGKGSLNNKNLPIWNDNFLNPKMASSARDRVNEYSYNTGFSKRCFNVTNQTPQYTTTTQVVSEENLQYLARNYYKNAYERGTSDNNDVFYVLAQIRLKDICDFFDKLPLTRGAYLRLLINTNTAEHKINYVVRKSSSTSVGYVVQQLNNASTTITGGTSPLMVAAADDDLGGYQGNAWWAWQTTSFSDGAGGFWPTQATTSDPSIQAQFSVRCSIVKDLTSNIQHPIPNCRLYVPLYTMTNEEVSRYLKLQPTKHIVYRDIFQYQFDVEANGGTFSTLLTNGVANPKALILIPYIHSNSNSTKLTGTPVSGTAAAGLTTNLAPYQSPFASEPGTTSPYVGIRDYNVQLAGVNVYTSNTLYDFEAFRNELARINGLNGGAVDGLMSGLIGQEQFQANMRYYVTDLSRRIKAEDAVPKSIQVSGTNASQVKLTIFAFLEVERSVDVALDSGLLLS